MGRLRNPSVFRFCAIPQIMAIATLAECYGNPEVFKRVVKIPKGQRRAAGGRRGLVFGGGGGAAGVVCAASPETSPACPRLLPLASAQREDHGEDEHDGGGGAGLQGARAEARGEGKRPRPAPAAGEGAATPPLPRPLRKQGVTRPLGLRRWTRATRARRRRWRPWSRSLRAARCVGGGAPLGAGGGGPRLAAPCSFHPSPRLSYLRSCPPQGILKAHGVSVGAHLRTDPRRANGRRAARAAEG